ncbi:alkaline phosphatase PhoX [Altererythrobacter sp. CAU 1778]
MIPDTLHRRRFLQSTASAFAALAASGCVARNIATPGVAPVLPYGPLKADPAGMLDLPEGFSYRVISRLGDAMADGGTVPDRADGMGCFDLGGGRIALVRNHELGPGHGAGGAIANPFGRDANGQPLAGGTTTIVLNARTLEVERQHRSLGGTVRNCAGGTTPWGSWLTCEESMFTDDAAIRAGHGWVFEVPARSEGLVEPTPLKAMGRFNHEAAAIDPRTGVVYLTEDMEDSMLYRFIPKVPGKLAEGGRLQALAIVDGPADSRNWTSPAMAVGKSHAVRWIDMDDVEAPQNDLRLRGAAAGGLVIARGEGIHMGDGELYFAATSGGAAKEGQIFRFAPNPGGVDRLELFFESTSKQQFSYGDNLTIAPDGHLIVCEDQYTDVVDNHLRGITPDGVPYPFARLRVQTEPAGACFSPDGRTLFVNAYSPAATLAITGPWLWS